MNVPEKQTHHITHIVYKQIRTAGMISSSMKPHLYTNNFARMAFSILRISETQTMCKYCKNIAKLVFIHIYGMHRSIDGVFIFIQIQTQ